MKRSNTQHKSHTHFKAYVSSIETLTRVTTNKQDCTSFIAICSSVYVNEVK